MYVSQEEFEKLSVKVNNWTKSTNDFHHSLESVKQMLELLQGSFEEFEYIVLNREAENSEDEEMTSLKEKKDNIFEEFNNIEDRLKALEKGQMSLVESQKAHKRQNDDKETLLDAVNRKVNAKQRMEVSNV